MNEKIQLIVTSYLQYKYLTEIVLLKVPLKNFENTFSSDWFSFDSIGNSEGYTCLWERNDYQ